MPSEIQAGRPSENNNAEKLTKAVFGCIFNTKQQFENLRRVDEPEMVRGF